MPEPRNVRLDLAAYIRDVQSRPCFICRLARGDETVGTVVIRDDRHIVFLPKFFVQRGYVLVAPTEHREAVVGDFDADEYLALQRLIHRVGAALSAAVPTERLYILSLGSNQGNAHVHWHVVALPPGVPYDEQQFHALMAENGVLDVTSDEQRALAKDLARRLSAPDHT